MTDTTNEISITPHAGQVKVLTSKKRFILALAGIQGGKTFIGCIWMQLKIQDYPTGNFLICGLSRDQVNNVLLDKFFSIFPSYKVHYNRKDSTVYLPSGGKIFFRSLEDPKYTEGITAHAAWIDEADLVSYKGYMVVRGRLSATGGPLLMTSSIADNSWISEYMQRLDPKYFDIVTWASNANPAFSKDEWEELQTEIDPTLFRRRYMADPQFATGRVYGTFVDNQDKYVMDDIPSGEFIKKAFIGIDWGYVDPTAVVAVGLSNFNNVWLLDDFSVEGTNLDTIVNVVNKFKKVYETNLIYADPQNKIFLKTVQERVHTLIQPGERDIFDGTTLIRNLIFQGRFFVRKRCEHVLYEMRNYRFEETGAGRSEKPADKYNHTLDAIRYVVATYPIPKVKYLKTEEKPEIIPFWARRTKQYQEESKRALKLPLPYKSDDYIY